MENIVITKSGILYSGKIFRFSEVNCFLKIIPKRINIIIADEEILIKRYSNYDKGRNLKELVEEDFFSGNGILIDNTYDSKKKELILYGVRDNYIKLFYKNKIKSIIPIQKLVANHLVKVNKHKDLKFKFKFQDKIYLGLIKNENLVENKIINEKYYEDISCFNEIKDEKEVFLEIKDNKILIS